MNTNQAYFDGVLALAPELVLGISAFVALFSDRLVGRRSSRGAGWTALAGLGLAVALLMSRGQHAATTVFAMVEVDHFAAFFQLLMSAGCAVAVLVWMFEHREPRAIPGEALFLLLVGLLGGWLAVGTNHALLCVLGLEVLSLSCYALAGFDKQRPASAEAALKFITFGCLTTACMLYGLSLFYGLSGTLDFARMGSAEAVTGTSSLAQQLSSDSLPLAIALMLVLAGFAGRIALAPLHFSAPDVLEGAPSPVSAFLTLVYKVAGFGALLRFLAALFVQDHVSRTLAQYAGKFGLLLAILAAVTMAIGTLGAMRQAGLKRWLAYSSIAHSGFAMIGVACLNETGFNAALVYLAISTLTHAGAFAFLICFERTAGTERLEDLRGLGWRSPIAGVGLTLLMLSLTGLPPTVGFYGKYRLFAEAWNDGLGWLMFTAALATLISLSTSLRVARVLFFHTPSTTQPATQPARARVLLVLAVALSLATLCFGIWPRSIEQWANSALDLLRE